MRRRFPRGENRKLSCDRSDIRAPGIGASDLAGASIGELFDVDIAGHAILAVYTTLHDSSEVWDIIPMMEFLLENTTDPNRISFLVTGVYKFRVGVRRSGSTDTIKSADLSYRKDGVNVQGAQMPINPVWPKPYKWLVDPGSCTRASAGSGTPSRASSCRPGKTRGWALHSATVACVTAGAVSMTGA